MLFVRFVLRSTRIKNAIVIVHKYLYFLKIEKFGMNG